jgi:hypothetical protein
LTAHDLFIVEQQPLPYKYLDDIIAIASRWPEHLGLLLAFSYGVMEGKRMERAKRKTPESKETQS